MVVEKNFGKKYDLIINYNDIDNNKKLLIEKIKVLKIPKYLKNIMSNKVKVI
jgi:flavoprotein